jgi:sortase A
MTRGDRVRWWIRGVGQVLITAGLVLLLFCVYEIKVTPLYTKQEQKTLEQELKRQWSTQPKKGLAAFEPGKGIARIYLPSLGPDEVHVVVEGVATADLKRGPGHYPGTALPGSVGNVVISGHRTTYGAPFNRLDELHPGDAIVVETQGFFYTYRVLGTTIVQPSKIGETYPVPNEPGRKPTQALLTLTTCNPKYSARTRLVVRALLEKPLAKRPGVVPEALEG